MTLVATAQTLPSLVFLAGPSACPRLVPPRASLVSSGLAKRVEGTSSLGGTFRLSQWSRPTVSCRAVPSEVPEFDLTQYVEGKVQEVKATDGNGFVILLAIGDKLVLPIYVGDAECFALKKELDKRNTMRPMTHDLMKTSLEMLGFRVTKVRVHSLVGNTYHARVHYAPGPAMRAAGSQAQEVDVDARPSDAINLAVRFNAPLYVSKEVAAKMGQRLAEVQLKAESTLDIKRSCKDDILHYPDPTLHLQLQLQLAIANDDFTLAAQLRGEIDRLLGSDRVLSLVVAIETALSDERYEEAARLRDELRDLRAARVQSSQAEAQEA